MISGVKDQWGQLRKRAVLVDRLNKKCLDANWRPLLSESELEDANHRLDEAYSILKAEASPIFGPKILMSKPESDRTESESRDGPEQ